MKEYLVRAVWCLVGLTIAVPMFLLTLGLLVPVMVAGTLVGLVALMCKRFMKSQKDPYELFK